LENYKIQIEKSESVIENYRTVLHQTLEMIKYEGVMYGNKAKLYRFLKRGKTIEFFDVGSVDNKKIVFE